jgi:hypothetical protein
VRSNLAFKIPYGKLAGVPGKDYLANGRLCREHQKQFKIASDSKDEN